MACTLSTLEIIHYITLHNIANSTTLERPTVIGKAATKYVQFFMFRWSQVLKNSKMLPTKCYVAV